MFNALSTKNILLAISCALLCASGAKAASKSVFDSAAKHLPQPIYAENSWIRQIIQDKPGIGVVRIGAPHEATATVSQIIVMLEALTSIELLKKVMANMPNYRTNCIVIDKSIQDLIGQLELLFSKAAIHTTSTEGRNAVEKFKLYPTTLAEQFTERRLQAIIAAVRKQESAVFE